MVGLGASAAIRGATFDCGFGAADEVADEAPVELWVGAFLLAGCEPHPATAIDVATMAMTAPLIAVRCIDLLLSTPGLAEA
jgi:hypothetical protein